MKPQEIIVKGLNEHQRKFVESDSLKDILVSASAGTGKTTSMINKILYLIVDSGVSVENLLVLTFTNAAANEMKIKLFKSMQKLLSTITDDSLKERLSTEIELINNADIGTSHSFCKKLITKYFYVVGVDPAFSLVSDKEQAFLVNEAITNVFNNYVINDDEKFFELYECYNSKRETTVLKRIVKTIFNYLKSVVNGYAWKQNMLDNTYNLNLADNTCAQFLMQSTKDDMNSLLPSLNHLENQAKIVANKKLLEFIENLMQAINLINTSSTYQQLSDSLHNFKYLTKPRKTKDLTTYESELYDDMAEVWDRFKKVRDEKKKFVLNASEKAISYQLSVIKQNLIKIFEIVGRVDEEYASLKKSRQLLDFNDLELYTIKLLDNALVLNEIKEQYQFIFFDEYQDVNNIQELILSKLKRPNNLIMIGDVKQSIYEFRLSQPKNFIDKYNNKAGHQIFNFNENYRSEDNILQFVNGIFEDLIRKDTIGVDYSEAMLKSGKPLTNNKVVSMDIINSTADEKNKALRAETVEGEARLIAKKISEFVTDAGYTYKDIAVLTRNKTKIAVLYEILQECNIPVSVEYRTNLFESYEVCLLVNFLKLLNNFQDDIALTSVLKSFMINLDENELTEIRLSDIDSAFWQAVLSYNKDDEILSKITKLKEHLNFYKNYMINHTIFETLEKLLIDFDMLNYFNSLPDGWQKTSNINEFLTFSLNDNYAFCLAKFLDYIKTLADQPQNLSVGEGDNCVKIITMHSSKGLDYPCVIVTGLGEDFRFDNDSNLLINDTFGIGLKYIDGNSRIQGDCIVGNACKLINIKNKIDEEIRLFYVALTRAKNRLHLIGSYKLNNVYIKKDNTYACRSFLDLFFYSCDQVSLYNFANLSKFVLNEKTSKQCEVRIYSVDETQFDRERNKTILLSGGDVELAKTLSEYYNFVYPHTIEKEIAIKNSVTSLMREEEPYEKITYAPSQFKLNDKDKVENNDALNLGNFYHAVMERLNYNESIDEIEEIIENVASENIEWKEIKDKVSPSAISKAVATIRNVIDGGVVRKESQFILSVPHSELIKGSLVDDKIMVQGVVDFAVDFSDHAIIIDFKTNKFTHEEQFKNTYSLQLEIYAKAYEYAFNKPVKNKFIYSFELGKLIEV